MTDRQPTRIKRWIKSGSSLEDGTLGWLLGNLLWWRIWAVCSVITVGLALALLVDATSPPGTEIIAGYAFGLLAGSILLFVSPKYEVTKNY